MKLLQSLEMTLPAQKGSDAQRCNAMCDGCLQEGEDLTVQEECHTAECDECISNKVVCEPCKNVFSYGLCLTHCSFYVESLHVHLLNQLLENNHKWKWTEQCDKAFLKVKEMITSKQVLTHYDPSLPLRLACDACPVGIGAVLSHVMIDGSERPIAFASRTLTIIA